jgi:hypothetical protein
MVLGQAVCAMADDSHRAMASMNQRPRTTVDARGCGSPLPIVRMARHSPTTPPRAGMTVGVQGVEPFNIAIYWRASVLAR